MNVIALAVTMGFETLINESELENPNAYGWGSGKKMLRTCVKMEHNGYEISLSNMLGQPTGELGVWHDRIDQMLYRDECTPQGIMNAMEWIDKHAAEWSDDITAEEEMEGEFFVDSVDAQILHDEGGDITDGATDEEK